MHSQCLSFIYSGKAHEGKAKLRTGLGKSDRPGSQGGLRKRELLVELGTRRTTERVRVGNSPPKERPKNKYLVSRLSSLISCDIEEGSLRLKP